MKRYKGIIITVLAALAIGFTIGALSFADRKSGEVVHDHQEEEQVWTCSMHPQVRQSEPGQCPICGMDLIPLADLENEIDPMAISMTERAMKLADVQTTVVGGSEADKRLSLTGKIQEDESQVYSQSAHFAGRIEKLFVTYTGEYIQEGQKIASVYSPVLITAQEELFEAKKFGNEALVRSARKKLKLWKLSDEEIEAIESSGEIMMEVPVRSDISGVVTEKKVNLGDHVKEGSVLFEVANLSQLWVVFDAYESDLNWIDKGNKISFIVASVPGKTFETTVTFIDPIINRKTRVAAVRGVVNNKDGSLKPEMLVNGIVKGESIGDEDEIVVPRSAVMWTGKRSVVYVKVPDVEQPAFIMTEVVIGPAVADSYIIVAGLKAGDEVVTNGTFTIDAAAQLQGKKSMMNPEGTPVKREAKKAPLAFKQQLTKTVEAYFELKKALVNSDADEAVKSAKTTLSTLEGVDMTLLEGEQHNSWMKLSGSLKEDLQQIIKSDLKTQRERFISLSDNLTLAVRSFGVVGEVLYIHRCPMADNNQGANWLSDSKEVLNPYFGEAMLKCGEVIGEVEPQ